MKNGKLAVGRWPLARNSGSRTECRSGSGQRPAASGHMPRVRGFTLIELVVVITLTAIVVAFCAMFIVAPVNSYNAQARRAELVDSADAVLRLVGRDARSALPNSIRTQRTGSIVVLEMLNAVDGVRYRSTGATADPTQELDFSGLDDKFATESLFDGITRPFVTTTHYLVIYNVGVPGADAYSLTNVITPPNTSITIASSTTPNEDLITLSPTFKFAYGSPGKRVYLVSGPVTYLCNEAAQTIRRYSGYAIIATPPTQPSDMVGGTSSLVANRVTACQFDYAAGTAQRAGLVTLRVTMNKDGESVWLVHQVHVENAP